MKHNKKHNHLSRTASHRKAMLSNMACSLIEHKRINTTVAKAKALRMFIEPIITKSKTDTTHSRRLVFSTLQSKEHVTELFREVAPKVMSRAGGYTRIIKTGFRQGDGAETAMIELVDFNELYGNETKKKSSRRRRGGGKAKTSDAAPKTEAKQEEAQATEAPKAEVKEEAKAAEAKAETPKAEAKEETPKAEAKKEEPKAEAKEETPEAEAKKEEPKAEAKEEAPKAEAKKEEPKAEEKAPESKDEDAEADKDKKD